MTAISRNEPRLAIELSRFLRQRVATDAPLVLIGHGLAACVVAVTVWSRPLAHGILAWLTALLLVTSARAGWLRACRSPMLSPATALAGIRLATLLLGIAWGSGSAWLVQVVPMGRLTVLFVAVSGLAAGAMSTLVADPRSYFSFLLSQGLLVGAGLTRAGYYEVAGAVLVGALILVIVYQRAHAMLLEHLSMTMRLAESEAALRESESRFRRIADSNVVGICFWEADGSIPWANGELLRISGHTPDDLMASRVNWRAMSPAEYGPRNQQLVEAAGRGETVALEERDILRSDGSRIRVMLGIAPLENATDRGVAVVLDVSALKDARDAQDALIAQLRESLGNVRTLTDLLPICSVCKKIRDDDGYWSGVEKYITEHTGTMFSHGVCPECFPVLFPDVTV